jgi:integrase
MASISYDPSGRARIQFIAGDGKRKTISLAGEREREVQRIAEKIEALNAAVKSGFAPDEETAAWLRKVGARLHAKLVKVGLVESRAPARPNCPMLGEYLDQYRASRGDVAEGTRTSWGVIGKRIITFFVQHRRLERLDQVQAGHADDFADWLRTEYAPATAAKTIKVTRQIFRRAVRAGHLDSNPFDELKAGNERNRERNFFVDPETVQRVIDSCPDAEWRLIVALARWGGLRTPSETLSLTWPDVLNDQDRFRVHSPKTRRHGKGERIVPIFPELRPYFEEAWLAAEEDVQERRARGETLYVITRYRDSTSANLRTQLLRIMARAGVEPWPRLFQNLRASRETELAKRFPLRAVTDWIGNSPNVAHDHYLSTTEEDFQRAASEPGPLEVAHRTAQNGPEGTGTGGKSSDGDDENCPQIPVDSDMFYSGAGKEDGPAWTRTMVSRM